MKKSRTPRVTAAVLIGATALSFTEWRPRAAGTISGVVFEDFNGNGVRDTSTPIPNIGQEDATPPPESILAAVDRGVPNVTVTVFDNAGNAQGSGTTDAAGVYSIVTTGTGPYRVEFTTLPAGYFPSRFAAGPTGNGTTVQFVTDGDKPDINLGILDPANFCANNPTFAISCYLFGEQTTGPNAVQPVIVDFPYSAGAIGNGATAYFQPTDHTLMVEAQSVGTTYGMAYRRGTNTLYTSAFMKKHAGFGPLGTGAIYALNPGVTPGGAPDLFFDLNTLFGGAGPNPHLAPYARDNGNIAWDAVGKVSLGGLEVSPDGAFVYVVNLFDRHVYRLPTGAGAPQRVPVPVPAGVPPGDVRPFALQYYKGQLYVGLVNSAESTQNAADLRGFVYTLDPTTLAFSPAPVFQFPLNYPRGFVQNFNPVSPGTWLPWRTTFATNWTGTPGGIENIGTYPQPWLTGLAFDVDGNMLIGLRDRAGDQFGYFALSNPDPLNTDLWLGVGGGDTLLAEANVKGNPTAWTLESNSATGSFGPTGGAGNNQGPGPGPNPANFGEYFYQDDFLEPFPTPGVPPQIYHQEMHQGAVLQLPGFPDAMTTSMNPGRSTDTGGIMWLSRQPGLLTEGTKSKGYNLYSTPGVPDTFSKTNGLGEFVAICQAAPIEIGNRVWDDIDGDGVQDAGEPGLNGVEVQLIAPGGAVLATVVTADGGQYYFSSNPAPLIVPGNAAYDLPLTPNTAGFIVRITGGQPALGARFLTIANSDNTANGDSRDSDASTVGGNAEIVVNTGAAGSNNHTYDFGYTTDVPPPPLSLGNFVWYDTNNNGVVDAAEQPITGVDVVLYRDNGNGSFDELSDTVVATQTTAAGLYFFTGLTPGDYFVQIPALEFGSGGTLFGYLNSTGQNAGDIDNVDHGAPAPIAGQGIVSNLVTLTAGGEPGVPVDGDGTNSNLTIDFGFYKLSLGNFVFFDPDNSGTVTAGDTPASGVPVALLNNVGTVLQTTNTDAAGLYSFTGLAPGDYAVRITPPTGFTSSTGPAPANAYEPGPDPDNNIDNDDNGTNAAGITSALITLTPGAEPVVTNATGETSNPTVDFGLIQPIGLSLGNLVWRDTNNDGVVSPGETGIDGVTVRLFNGTGTVQLNQTVTAGGGFYLFTNLAPGQYIVEVAIPAGLRSTNDVATSANPDNNTDNDDNGVNLTATTVRSNVVTLSLGGEPVNDGDTDPNSNLTVDFGFCSDNTLSLGNLVWSDFNDNGVVDPASPGVLAEPGIPNIPVRLFAANGTMLLATTTTNANGNYLFTGLDEGTYFVEITPPQLTLDPPTNQRSSTDIASSGNPDNNIDNDDNGLGQSLNPPVIRSAAVNLSFGQEPITDGDTDANSNLTVDFGVPGGGGPGLLSSTCVTPTSALSSVQVGKPFTVTFAVTNEGPGQAENMQFDQMLPAALLVNAAKASNSGVCTITKDNVDCTWPGLTPVGAVYTVDVEMVSNAPPGTFVQIWAMTNAKNKEKVCEFDGYLSTDGSSMPTDLAITGMAQSSSQSGPLVASPVNQPVKTRFSVTNNGTITAGGRYEILLDNAALELVSVALSQGTADRTGALSGAWETGAITPGATATIDMTFMPRSGGVTKVTAIRSQGSSPDTNASNDTASFAIDGVGSGGGRSIAVGNVDGVAGGEILTGTGGGERSQIRVFSGAGSPMHTFFAFNRDFLGGVRVAACDVIGDARDEIVAAMGPGGGRIRVLSLTSGIVTDVVGFDAFENTFTGGVNVACADVDGDGKGEVVVAPDGGRQPEVRVYDVGVGGFVEKARFMAYEPSFTGGVRVAAAPFTGSGVVGAFNVVTMPGPGRAGELRTWSVSGASVAMGLGVVAGPTSGARVALGDANGDGGLDLLVMPDGGVSALINVYSLTTGAPLFSAPSGAAGFRSLDAAVGVLGGGPGVPEVVVGRGPGQSPDIVSFRVLGGGAIVPRLFFSALEVP